MTSPRESLRLLSALLVSASILFISLIFKGCAAPEEIHNNDATELRTEQNFKSLQKQISDLKMENTSLRKELDAMKNEKRILNARVALAESPPRQVARETTIVTERLQEDVTEQRSHLYETYEEALNQYRSHNYAEARDKFSFILNGGGAREFDDRCEYWVGECSFALRKYDDALRHYLRVMNFDHSTKLDDALMMVGSCYSALGEKKKATEAWEDLIERFPKSPYVKKAQSKLEKR